MGMLQVWKGIKRGILTKKKTPTKRKLLQKENSYKKKTPTKRKLLQKENSYKKTIPAKSSPAKS